MSVMGVRDVQEDLINGNGFNNDPNLFAPGPPLGDVD